MEPRFDGIQTKGRTVIKHIRKKRNTSNRQRYSILFLRSQNSMAFLASRLRKNWAALASRMAVLKALARQAVLKALARHAPQALATPRQASGARLLKGSQAPTKHVDSFA